MHKLLPVRLVAAAALVGSVGFAIAMPGAIAGAGGPKPPVTVTCTGLIGNSSNQVESGCVGTAKSKVTPYGVTVVNGSDTGATVYWTNKDDTTLSFTYSGITNACPTYLDQAASLEEQETATVTGGTSKLTLETAPPADVCIYIGSTDGSILVVGDGSYTD
jgi:hypothetical protein